MIRPFYPFMRAKIKLFFSSDLIHEIKKSIKKKSMFQHPSWRTYN